MDLDGRGRGGSEELREGKSISRIYYMKKKLFQFKKEEIPHSRVI